MDGYRLVAWSGLFTAEVGASASLTGLLFVALSINLRTIVSYPRLPARAAETLVLLVLVLVVCSCGLLPESSRLFGVEVLALVVPFEVGVAFVQARHGPDSPEDPWWWFASRVASVHIGSLMLLVCGATLVARSGGGLWWALPAVGAAFAGATYNAWVLLVEIIRAQQRSTAPEPGAGPLS